MDCQSKEKLIPVIKYNPYNFISSVRTSFHRIPHIDYIKINSDKYYLNTGIKEEEIYNTKDFGLYGLNTVINTDSLFLFYFTENPSKRYQGLLPVSYYGILKDSKVYFYKNQRENTQKLTLLDVINIEYGSVDKMKESISLDFNRNIDLNISNGIYLKDIEAAIKQLQTDYEYYWECFPNNRNETFDLFFRFLDNNIRCSTYQKEKIKEMALNDTGESIQQSVAWLEPYYNKKINLMGKNISHILLQVLPKEQYTKIIEKNEIRSYLKRYYLFDSNILSKPRYKIENGDTIIPTEQEQDEYKKNLVFGK
jgi:hypothetical protein